MATITTLRALVRYKLMDQDATPANQTWLDAEIDSAINDAIKALWPDCYIRRVDNLGTTATDTLAYDLPAGVERVGRVDVEKVAGGSLVEVMNWEEDTNEVQIRFFKVPLTTGLAILATSRGKFAALSGDTASTHPDYLDQAVVLYATASLLEKLRSERSKFTQYSAKLNKEAATMEDLVVLIRDMKNEFHTLLDQYRMPPIESARRKAGQRTEGVQPAHSGRSRKGATEGGGER